MLKILVVDDNRTSAQAMARILTKQGHVVTALFDGQSAIDAMRMRSFDLVFTDLKMEPVDGMEVLRAARAHQPPIEVIVFTAFGAVEHAVEAIQLGARDFLTKPISVDQILSRVRALTGEEAPTDVGTASVPQSLRSTLEAVASVPSPVWLQGELGSGRVEAAELLHQLGGSGQLVLFEPGMRTPAEGTLLFRDVDDLDEAAQAAAITALRNPGALKLVATARPNVRERVLAGDFRSDLYFSLAVLTIEVPPLRNRSREIPALFTHALEQFCTRFGKEVPELTEAHRRQLEHHPWPANLRELRNLAERTAVLGIDSFSLREATPMAVDPMPLFGVAFTLSSDSTYRLFSGSTKNICNPRSGSLPSSTKRPTPMSTVMASASTGLASDISLLG